MSVITFEGLCLLTIKSFDECLLWVDSGAFGLAAISSNPDRMLKSLNVLLPWNLIQKIPNALAVYF